MMQVVQDQPKGWMCPGCGKAHGPHIDTCPGWPGWQQTSTYADFVGPRDLRHSTAPAVPIYRPPGTNGWRTA